MSFYYSFCLCNNSKNGITKKEWFILMVHCWCHWNSVIINYFYFCSVFGFYYLLKVNNNIVLKIVVFPKNNPHIYCTNTFKQVYAFWDHTHIYKQYIFWMFSILSICILLQLAHVESLMKPLVINHIVNILPSHKNREKHRFKECVNFRCL